MYKAISSKSELASIYKHSGIVHNLILTNNTSYIERDTKKYILNDFNISFKDLAFIRKVNKEITENHKLIHGEDTIKVSNIKYCRFSRDGIRRESKYIEVDINKAYWVTCFLSGYISEDTYKDGLERSKIVRLISLGSLASDKRYYNYDGIEYIEYKRKKDETKASYFFNICKIFDDIMNNIFINNKVLFYWVDAFFIDIEQFDNIKKDIILRGYDFKEIPISDIRIERFDTYNKYVVINRDGQEKFFINDKKRK